MQPSGQTEMSKDIVFLFTTLFHYLHSQLLLVCKIPVLARRTRPSAARDDRVSCIQSYCKYNNICVTDNTSNWQLHKAHICLLADFEIT